MFNLILRFSKHFLVQNASVIIPRIRARKIGINLKTPEISELNVCTTLIREKCPLKKGDIVTSLFRLPTEVTVPWSTFECTMEISMVNEKGESLGCFSLPVIIYE